MAKKVEYIVALKDKTSAQLSKIGGSFSKFATTTKSKIDALKTSFGQLGGVISSGAILGFSKSLLKMSADLQAVADRANVSGESLQAFLVSTQRGGGTLSELNIGLVTLRKQQQNAVNGMPEAVKAFNALGISIEDLSKLTNEELLEAVAKGIKKTGDFGNGFKIMGESTARLHQLINDLADDGVVGLTEKMTDLNQVVSNETLRGLEQANNTLTEFGNTAKILGAKFLGGLQSNMERSFSALMALPRGFKAVKDAVSRETGDAGGPKDTGLESRLAEARAQELAEAEIEARKKGQEEYDKETEKIMRDAEARSEQLSNDLAEAQIASIQDESAKEIAEIGKTLQDKLKALTGGSEDELKLRKQLAENAQVEINKILEDSAKAEKDKADEIAAQAKADAAKREKDKADSGIAAKNKAIADADLGMMGFKAAIDDANKSPDERKAEEKARRREASALAKVERARTNKNFKASKKDMEIARVAGLKEGFKGQQEKKKKAMQELADLEKKAMDATIKMSEALTKGGNK